MELNHFTAIEIAEGIREAEDEEQYLDAWQYLVDTGLAWQLQGSIGRYAAMLIDSGLIFNNIEGNNENN